MKKANILVCDDEAGVRDSLQLILGQEYDLVYVENGAEAVRHVKTGKPNLVIMDIKMPRMNGLEALKRMKRLKPRLPVLIITGYESSDAAGEAIGLGADRYLVKPFERQAILAQVRQLLKE